MEQASTRSRQAFTPEPRITAGLPLKSPLPQSPSHLRPDTPLPTLRPAAPIPKILRIK
jgi:hypothetical protein